MQEYRRNLEIRTDDLVEILPAHFFDDYPILVKLFEYYYEFLRGEGVPSSRNRDLFKTRDITAVAEELLPFMQAELLLGVDYFQGFGNARDALKFNNLLYSSKGSTFSIQQFFRYFFGIDPEVIYTKQNMFIVGESNIGVESQDYIKDDKLYQTFAVLIKTPISVTRWEEVYKLFVHPAGVYLGAEVQIIGVADVGAEATFAGDIDFFTGPTITDVATLGLSSQGEITGIE